MSRCKRSLYTSSISLWKRAQRENQKWNCPLGQWMQKHLGPVLHHTEDDVQHESDQQLWPTVWNIWHHEFCMGPEQHGCTHNTKCSSHTGLRVSGLTSVTWMHLAGSTSLVLERFSSFSLLFLKLNFLSFFSSTSRGLWPTRIPSMQ